MTLKYLYICSSLILSVSAPIMADDTDYASATLSADYVSEYVFRGATLAAEALQPGVEAKYGPWTLGAWASVAVGEESEAFANEFDLYLGFGWQLGDMIDGEIGATIYHYPQSGGLLEFGANEASTAEVYSSLSFDAFLSPSVNIFYDMHLETVTVEGNVTQAFEVFGPVTFELFASAGLVESSGSASLDYQYGTLSGISFFDVTENAAIYAGAYYGLSSENTFLDTKFNLSEPSTLSNPSGESVWLKAGLSSTF